MKSRYWEKYVLVGLLMGASAAQAQQPQWKLLSSDEKEAFYINQSGIEDVNPDVVQFWTLTEKNIPSLFNGKIVSSTLTLQAVNCSAKTIGPVQLLAISGRCGVGDVVATESYGEALSVKKIAVPPGTLGASLVNLMCSGSMRAAMVGAQASGLCTR